MAKRKLKVEKNLAEELVANNSVNISTLKIPDPSMECQIPIKFKLDEDATLPSYAHEGDACMDVYATSLEYDEEYDTYIYYTGLSYESMKGIVSLGFARSSNCFTECYLTNGVGVIDCAVYRGKIQYRFKNRTSLETRIKEAVMLDMLQIPWYKKIFMSESDLAAKYNELYAKWNEYYVIHALDFAPFNPGDKIGQIMFLNYFTAIPEVVDELSETERGKGGFGSTGCNKENGKR